MRTLFEITNLEVREAKIIITVLRDGQEEDKKVNKSKFQDFLERSCRLAIPMQFHDDEGSAELAFSAMTYPEYYENGDVKKDLYDYILLEQGEDVFGDVLKSMQVELADYNN